jgi:Mn2+/Fe2+ NRAMP family transporter
MLFSFPLMAAIQEICARLGRITGMGVAANLAKCYPKTFVRGLVLLPCVANVVNLGADVAAMAAAIQLLVGGNLLLYASFSERLRSCCRFTFHTAFMFVI